jgi:polyhydroxyalkanoate synthase
MVDQAKQQSKQFDSNDITATMAEIAERSQRIVREFLSRHPTEFGDSDPTNVGGTFMELTTKMMSDPTKLLQAQMNLWQDYMALWQHTSQRMMGEEPAPLITPANDDRRFKHPEWDDNHLFNFIKQTYLLTARSIQSTVHDVDGLDDKTAKKANFYTRQFVDAMAPSNFVLTNPEVLQATVSSGGENQVRGLRNLLQDLEDGDGQLRIRMTDPDAFTLGENIAVTPGKVVYQNDLIQLLQYEPATKQAYKRPLMIIPPWINKYYILDLRPKNSFIKWAVARGYTVFVLSWVNPDTKLAAKSFADYLHEGPLAALDAIEQATGSSDITAIGYCLGGTLLACTMAYMAAKGDDRIKAATYFASMVDFAEPGDLGVFIDEEQLASLDERMAEKGYLDGKAMAGTFSMMRSNDLVWSFVINNYLLGKDPFPFDLLHWNSDSTRMPATMHSFYLRKMYMENAMVDPGGITLDGVAIDLRKIETPSYVLSTRDDHIAPWTSTYAATQLYSGPVRFVLAASGHIAGVINPPEAKKYSHWIGQDQPASPETWLEDAEEVAGSWWGDWHKWNAGHAGKKGPARTPGGGKLTVIEDAPGSYANQPAE